MLCGKHIMVFCGKTNNETEVKFTFGNPVVNKLCPIHGYFLYMEEKLSTHN